MWVGTAGGELYRLIDGHLSIVANQGTTAQDEINTIIEGREGSLWIATWNGGLTRWKDGAMEVFGPQEGLPQTEIFSLAEDRWGSIWIGTRKGLFVLSSAADGRRHDLASGERRDLRAVARSRGLDLVRHVDRPRSIQRLAAARHTAKSTDFPIATSHRRFPPARGASGWVPTAADWRSIRDGKIAAEYGVADGLRSNDVTSVCEARDGTVWLGSWGEGLYQLKNAKIAQVDVGDRLKSGIVRSIFEDRAGDIWIGTWGDGLLRFHGDGLKSYTTRDGLADDHVRVIEEDRAGNLWIATQSGLNRFRDGHFHTYSVASGLSENSIFALRADAGGSLWIGTWGAVSTGCVKNV